MNRQWMLRKESEKIPTGGKGKAVSTQSSSSELIEGNSIESVTKASENKAGNSRALDYSHFVSLPLAIHPGLVDKLVNFQKTILQIVACDNDTDAQVKGNIASIPLVSHDPKKSKTPVSQSSSSKLRGFGIEKSIFINPKTFHLTILMLKLWNKERVNAASEVLRSVSSQVMNVLDNRPVSIKLKGLDCMKGSLANARVLYAPVEEVDGEDRCSIPISNLEVIIEAFAKAGLLIGTDAQQKLKLHATLMNVRHRNRNKNTRKLDSFDARVIFDRYGSEEWGEYPIREAHLSQRFVYDENGYYHCCASIPFPSSQNVGSFFSKIKRMLK